jgi:hypothetical protein
MITSFRNTGIESQLHTDGRVVDFVDVNMCQTLLHPFMMADLAECGSSLQSNTDPDEPVEPEDLVGLPFWLQPPEEEPPRFTE